MGGSNSKFTLDKHAAVSFTAKTNKLFVFNPLNVDGGQFELSLFTDEAQTNPFYFDAQNLIVNSNGELWIIGGHQWELAQPANTTVQAQPANATA